MEALGPILLVLAIPLSLRWIPRNRFFGLRIPATLGDDALWYDVNALHGRHLLLLGLVMVTLEFLLPVAVRTPVLATIGFVGVLSAVTADWRTANRLRRERGAIPGSR